MKYRVIWNSDAEGDLASVWMRAVDRAGVTEAAKRLDEALGEQGDALGESRSGGVRVAFCPPLGIEFEFVAEDRTVYVLGVWSFGRGSAST